MTIRRPAETAPPASCPLPPTHPSFTYFPLAAEA